MARQMISRQTIALLGPQGAEQGNLWWFVGKHREIMMLTPNGGQSSEKGRARLRIQV